MVWGLRIWCTDSMNILHSSSGSLFSHSSQVKLQYADLCRTWSFGVEIYAIMAELTSIIVPRYLLIVKLITNRCSFASKYNPCKPFKLTKLAYVWCLASHYFLKNFPIMSVYTMNSIRSDVWFKFQVIIPKSLGCLLFDHFSLRTILLFLYFSLHYVQPWVNGSIGFK